MFICMMLLYPKCLQWLQISVYILNINSDDWGTFYLAPFKTRYKKLTLILIPVYVGIRVPTRTEGHLDSLENEWQMQQSTRKL